MDENVFRARIRKPKSYQYSVTLYLFSRMLYALLKSFGISLGGDSSSPPLAPSLLVVLVEKVDKFLSAPSLPLLWIIWYNYKVQSAWGSALYN